MPEAGGTSFRAVPADTEPAAALLEAFRRFIAQLYDGLDVTDPSMPSAGPSDFRLFLVGFDEHGEPVCCGGLKPLGPGIAEIKRMFVVPEARGRGVGRELLARLEQEAGRAGFSTVRLDTGPRQAGAERMYRDAGYRTIGNYNSNPVATFFGEKQLPSQRRP